MPQADQELWSAHTPQPAQEGLDARKAALGGMQRPAAVPTTLQQQADGQRLRLRAHAVPNALAHQRSDSGYCLFLLRSPLVLWAQVCSHKPVHLLCADPGSLLRAQWGPAWARGLCPVHILPQGAARAMTPVRAQGTRPADLAYSSTAPSRAAVLSPSISCTPASSKD